MLENMKNFTKEEAKLYEESLNKVFKPTIIKITSKDILNFIKNIKIELSNSIEQDWKVRDLVDFLENNPDCKLEIPINYFDE